MTTATFEYWRPGIGEERQLRIFISHRYGGDKPLYDKVIDALNRSGISVQDISLSAEQVLRGPRGGRLSKMEVQAEIAARIYTSDVVVAPSRPAISRSEWVTWEVQLAAIGYGIPVLFVSEQNQRRTRLVSDLNKLGLDYRVCNPVVQEIIRGVAELARNPRPTWAMRQEEADAKLKFLGPTQRALSDVLRKHPFRPRLAALEARQPAPRRGLWGFISSRDHPA
jgi:hypothetical protein